MPEESTNGDEAVIQFIDEMIEERGLKLDPQQQERLRELLMQKIEGAVEEAVVMALPDVQAIELSKKIDAGMTDEELDGYFQAAGVDFVKVTKEAMEQVRADFLAGGTTPVKAESTVVEETVVPQGTGQEKWLKQEDELVTVQGAEKQPVQGTVSEEQGNSDIEGGKNE